MKKVLAIVLACVMVCGLTACGNSKKTWTDDDLIMRDGSDEIEVKEGCVYYGFEDVSYLDDYEAYVDGDDDYEEEYDEEFATNRGLELGMEFEDYDKLYSLVEGYAVWEVITGEYGEYTEFAPYDGEDMEEIYDEYSHEDYPNIWLDLGYYKEDGKWVMMEDTDLQDVWFCQADEDDFKEVAILSVNMDEDGEIIGICLSHINYNEDWEIWQSWEY